MVEVAADNNRTLQFWATTIQQHTEIADILLINDLELLQILQVPAIERFFQFRIDRDNKYYLGEFLAIAVWLCEELEQHMFIASPELINKRRRLGRVAIAAAGQKIINPPPVLPWPTEVAEDSLHLLQFGSARLIANWRNGQWDCGARGKFSQTELQARGVSYLQRYRFVRSRRRQLPTKPTKQAEDND